MGSSEPMKIELNAGQPVQHSMFPPVTFSLTDGVGPLHIEYLHAYMVVPPAEPVGWFQGNTRRVTICFWLVAIPTIFFGTVIFIRS